MPQSATLAIKTYNKGREPERLALKMAAMRGNAFSFLRGTCHLFHARMMENKLAPTGPSAWICGDLHLENFGTYLADNGLTYFDINDFDEGIAAPHSWDILRAAVSVLVAAPEIGLKPNAARDYAARLVATYYAELARGKPLWIERRTAKGPIGDLLETLKKRDGVKFLNKRTIANGSKRSIVIDGRKTLALNPSDRRDLAAFLAASPTPSAAPKSMDFIDAARRIAGTGSLGLARFVLLVEGDGSPDGNWLLDLKAAVPSALAPYLPARQHTWNSQAQRVVAVQTLFQANTPGLLSAQTFHSGSFILKQLQPSADRLDLNSIASSAHAFDSVIDAMARLAAWGHLRGAGRYGSATADELIAAASDAKAPRDVLDRAETLAKINTADWAQYCAAFDNGELKAA